MSRSYWLSIIALGLTLVVEPSLAKETIKNEKPIPIDRPTDQAKNNQNATKANDSAADPVYRVHTTLDEGEAVAAKEQQRIENERADQELYDQRRMAIAAEQIVHLTLVQIALGVLGTIGVLFSLYYARKAAESATSANKLMQSGQRAWLSVTLDGASESYGGEGMVALQAFFKTENFGNTPATGVRLYAELIPKPDLTSHPEDGLNVFVDECRTRYLTDRDSLTFAVFPDAAHRPPRPITLTGENAAKSGIIVLNCCVVYKSGLAPELLHTGAIFTIILTGKPIRQEDWLGEGVVIGAREVDIRSVGIRSMS